MIKKIIFVLLLFISPWPVVAQECNPPFEMVTRLHKPEPGAYTVWNAEYGDADYDQMFRSILPLDDGSVLAAGSRGSILGARSEIIFVTFDRLGRVMSEQFFILNGLRDVVKIQRRTDGGYVVLANIVQNGREKIWLGFFDDGLKNTSHRIFEDERDELSSTDMVPSVNSGWVISVSARRSFGEGTAKVDLENSHVYFLDRLGEKIQRRSYSPGGNNHISGLSVLKRGGEVVGYIATGYFVNNSGKKIAWSLRLDPNLSLNWQSEYSRGLLAKIQASFSYLDDYILVLGDVLPSNGKPMGVWLALLDADDGRVLWQRYYYGEAGTHRHVARGVFVNQDNLIVLMMMAYANKERDDIAEAEEVEGYKEVVITDYVDYAHLLTLSPRGILLGGDTYFFGEGVEISQLVMGKDGSRIMAGHALVKQQDKEFKGAKDAAVEDPLDEEGRVFLPDVELSSKAKKGLEMLQKKIGAQEVVAHNKLANRQDGLVKKGWVVVGDRLDTYKDPCFK